MGIKRVENVGIPIGVVKTTSVEATQKLVKQPENLQELLSKPQKSQSADNFFSEYKALSVAGGILFGIAAILATKKFKVAKDFPGVKNIIASLFGKAPKQQHLKLLAETRDFISKETEVFYGKTRSISEIFNFEKNKAILRDTLNFTPKELFIKREDYRGFIEFLKKNGLANEINSKNIVQQTYRDIFAEFERTCGVQLADAERIYFKQKGVLNPDLAEIKSHLSPRKISLGKREERIPYFSEKGYTRAEVEKMLAESKDLTLESGSLLTKEHYRDEIYDLPFRFASASYNSFAKNGNAYIRTEIPEIFKGINEKELFESLDLLSTHLRRTPYTSFPIDSVVNVKIGGKILKCTSLGHGQEGSVFRITAQGQKPVILKTYYAFNDHSVSGVSFAPAGLYGGMGILREANMANVADVPKLFMANPVYIPVKDANSRYMGAWQLTEDACTRTRKTGKTFYDWLKERRLAWTDAKDDAVINGIVVDTGFIMNNTAREYLRYGWGDYDLNLLYSRYLNGETTQQILEFLKSIK